MYCMIVKVYRALGALLMLCAAPLVFAAPAIEVVDYLGRTVVLQKPAERIVALAPHIVENLFSAGAGSALVGAVGYSDYPEAAKALTRVGQISHYNLETIIELKPDLVVVWMATRGGEVLETLNRLGINAYASDPHKLDDVARSLRDYGRLAGTEEQAERAAENYLKQLNALRQRYTSAKPLSVFYEVWSDPLQTLNNDHIISDVLRLCGGMNIFGEETVLAPIISREALLEKDPAAIVRGGRAAEHAQWARAWRTWPQLQAVAKGHLYTVPDDWIARHTVRILKGAHLICENLDTARD